jgi:hypothetical protein
VHSNRGGADTVIVDGKLIVQGGKVATFDEMETLAECQRRADEIAERSGLEPLVRSPWPRVA